MTQIMPSRTWEAIVASTDLDPLESGTLHAARHLHGQSVSQISFSLQMTR
jgi:hypothetical protein